MAKSGKLTQKDVIEWCKTHVCAKDGCGYMQDYCTIREHVIDECNHCERENCRHCGNYK